MMFLLLLYCSLLRIGFCFFKNRGKSAREREKRRKPLPDFCRNMAPARGVVVHCDACMLGCGTNNLKNGVLKF